MRVLFLNSDYEIGIKVLKLLDNKHKSFNFYNIKTNRYEEIKSTLIPSDNVNLKDFNLLHNIFQQYNDIQLIILFYDREIDNVEDIRNILFYSSFQKEKPINVLLIPNETTYEIFNRDLITYNYNNYHNYLFNFLSNTNLEDNNNIYLEDDIYEYCLKNLNKLFFQDWYSLQSKIYECCYNQIDNTFNKNIQDMNNFSIETFKHLYKSYKDKISSNINLSNNMSIKEYSEAEEFIEIASDELWQLSLNNNFPNFRFLFDSSKVLEYLDLE
jgi:hypothetical protein